MKKVGIVMGSDSDMPVMSKAAAILDKLGVEYEMKIISAHREPDVFFEYARSAEERGFKVIIAGAGMAAHLPGMCAAIFPMPVIGIPMHTTSLGGRDSLYSIRIRQELPAGTCSPMCRAPVLWSHLPEQKLRVLELRVPHIMHIPLIFS